MFFSAAIGTALMPLYLWVLVIQLNLGLTGGALAYTAAVMSIAVANGVMVAVREGRLRREGAPHRCFHGWYVCVVVGEGVGCFGCFVCGVCVVCVVCLKTLYAVYK